MRRRILPVLLLLVVVVAASLASSAPGASSGTVVSATVPSATSITNQCTQPAGWNLGTVLPGSPATTDVGASVCRIRFSSSNDTSALRMYQADRENTAMARADPNWDLRAGDQDQLNGVEVGPAGKVLAYGSSGTIRVSTNSGATFPGGGVSTAGDSQIINDIDILESTPTIAWAAAHNGRIRYSADGGSTWVLQTSGTTEHLTAAHVESTTTALIGGTGGVVLRTTNTGGSWTPTTTNTTSGVEDIARRAANDHWFAASNNTVRRSTDGGLTWNAPAGAPVWAHWRSIELTGAQTVWLAGDSGGMATVARSTDHGATWQDRSTRLGANLLDMVAISDTEAWVAGTDGTLLHTVDGGATWTRREPPTTSSLAGIALATDGNLVISTYNNEVYRTTDGITFTVGYDGNTSVPLSDVDVVDSDRRVLVAVGDGGYIRRSSDRGTTWSTVASGTTEHLHSISFAPSGTGWAVGYNGTILRTTNAGTSWSAQTSPTGQHLLGVTAVSDSVGWAVGRSGTVLRTTNAGATWSTIVSGTTAQLYAVTALDGLSAWVGGTTGVIRATTNGGGAWVDRAHPQWAIVYDLHAVSATIVHGANNWTGYFSSNDGGATWIDSLYVGGRKAIAWERDRPVAIGAHFANMYATTDFGATWTDNGFAGHYMSPRGAAAIDANRVVIVGENETISVSRVRDPIADYGGAGSTWASPASGLFGVCLQDVGPGTTPIWAEDAGNTPGLCQPLAGDTWQAVPQAPTSIASTTLGTDAYVDLVWGFQSAGNQTPGTYLATVSFETVAPAA